MTLLSPAILRVEDDPGYGPLKQHIVDATGLAYYCDKDAELAALITRRLNALGIANCRSYLDRLVDGRSGEAELDALTDSLTIGETFFFRHHELFDALREQVFPELIDRNRQHQQLRIWSAGCAIGAEPYSLAILLRRDFGPQLTGWDVSIVGTDINRESLAQAERGDFGDWSLRSLSEDLKATCFIKSGQTWSIKDEYRRGVVFQYHNLVQHPFPSLVHGLSAFDLILCRNVMIYFEPTIAGRLVGQFHNCLIEGGWFVVGPSEPSARLFRAFQTVSPPGAVLYQKSPVCPSAPAWSPPDTVMTPSHAEIFTAQHPIPLTSKPKSVAGNRRMPLADHKRRRQPFALPTQMALSEVRMKLNAGQFEDAESCCQKLLNVMGMDPLAYFYYALVAEQRGRHAESEKSLRRAIYLDRDFVLAHYHLGLVLHRARNGSAARQSFRNVLMLLDRSDDAEELADADGLTIGALRQLTEMHLEVLSCT